jgi:hypothetical protein
MAAATKLERGKDVGRTGLQSRVTRSSSSALVMPASTKR